VVDETYHAWLISCLPEQRHPLLESPLYTTTLCITLYITHYTRYTYYTHFTHYTCAGVVEGTYAAVMLCLKEQRRPLLEALLCTTTLTMLYITHYTHCTQYAH
jgi:hypothetical protein